LSGGSTNGKKSADAKDIIEDKLTEPDACAKREGHVETILRLWL
jgi:hypothetical protein